MQTLMQDIRFAVRQLRNNTGFTTVAALTLALGIGANTAIFSVVNAVLLRPLPYSDPSRLVWVTEVWPKQHGSASVPSPDYANWGSHARVFAAMAAYDVGNQINLTGSGEPERIEGAVVTSSFFKLLGIQPVLGRGFLPEEDLPDGRPVVILSHDLWQRRFSGDLNIVGKSITLDSERYAVVGVLPRNFRFPHENAQPDCITPFDLPLTVDWYAKAVADTKVLARLRPGVSLEQARADLTAINDLGASQVSPGFSRMRVGMQVRAIPLQQKLVGDVRPAILVLMGAVDFVLLIACANIANLQLARTANRQREFAVRSAIGAGRVRLVRQLLTEGLLLSSVGGTAGLFVATTGIRILALYAPDNIVDVGQIWIDKWVLGFTLILTCVTGVLFGMAPALGISKLDLNETLKGARSRIEPGYGRGVLRKLLVVVELALALVLLVGSGLLVRSFVRLASVKLGFDPINVLTARVTLPEAKYSTPEQRRAFFEEILRRLEGTPGTQHVSLSSALPSDENYTAGIRIEGEPSPPPGGAPWVPAGSINPDYFRTMGIPLLAGRFFDKRDGTQLALPVIVNQRFARRFFPDTDPVGRRIRIGAQDGPWHSIVGVVQDVKQFGLNFEVEAEVYRPYLENTRSDMTIAIRTSADPVKFAAVVRDRVASIDSDQPIYDVATMEQRLSDSLATQRFNTVLLGIFAAMALLLATVGIYGVVAYLVSRRTKEIGIRIAMGATERDVLRLLIGQGIWLTVFGVALGLAGSSAVTRYLSTLLFSTRPNDPLTIAGVSLLLGSVALLAASMPARRAAKIDPMVALRYE